MQAVREVVAAVAVALAAHDLEVGALVAHDAQRERRELCDERWQVGAAPRREHLDDAGEEGEGVLLQLEVVERVARRGEGEAGREETLEGRAADGLGDMPGALCGSAKGGQQQRR